MRKFFSGYGAVDGYDLRKDPFKDLTQYRRSKIRKNYYFLNEVLSGTPKRVYRTKNKKRLRQTLKSQGIKHIPNNLKVAFIPDIERKTQIKPVKARKIVGRDEITGRTVDLVTMAPIKTVTMDVTRQYLFIEPQFLLESPLEAIREAMSLAKAKYYSIQAGVHEITEGEYKLPFNASDKEIVAVIDKLIKKYGNEEENSYWRNWLGGLIAYNYPRKSSFDMFTNRRDAVRFSARSENKKMLAKEKTRNRREIEGARRKAAVLKAIAKDRKSQIKGLTKQIKILQSNIKEFKGLRLTPREAVMLDKAKMQLKSLQAYRKSLRK